MQHRYLENMVCSVLGTEYSRVSSSVSIPQECGNCSLNTTNVVVIWHFSHIEKDGKRQWCSGNMEPFQGSAGGSIPP